ncbi:hypothetical protein D3C84_977240 [compost metagenome]
MVEQAANTLGQHDAACHARSGLQRTPKETARTTAWCLGRRCVKTLLAGETWLIERTRRFTPAATA